MSPGTVRWGGIMVFVGIALVIIIPLGFTLALGFETLARGGSTGETRQVMSVVLSLAMAAVVSFVFFTTKGYFNAFGYHRADVVIYLVIGVQIVSALTGVVTNNASGLSALFASGGVRALGVVGIIVLVTSIVVTIALLVFAIFCISFAKLGGGVWQAIGILYLIGLVGIITGVIIVIASAGFAVRGQGGVGPAVMAAFLIGISFLCYAAAVICHGIGLILGAGRMEREVDPAAVFD